MPPKPATSARRLRLAAELRKLRERADLSATEGARRLGVSQAQLSNIEASRFGVSPERIRALADIYECADQAYVDGLIELTRDEKNAWWETFRGILPAPLLNLAELEHHATRLRSANTTHVPGLLQTTDHAREIFRQVVPEFTATEVEHRVSHRLQRQAVLERSVPFSATVHEAALRTPVGGTAVARRQLEHLLTQSEREQVTLQVIPFSVGAHPGSGQTFFYMHGSVPPLDTVHLDQSHGPVLLDAVDQLDQYRALIDRMTAVALGPAESRDLIRTVIREL
ncbi:XRE family transcriptional regulator [Streptomyces triticagri]|uniref:XRE family transcriptional regulator n=1 Tax=Streptomyces triticagri TaxID=2293568 RepID=A0A372LXA3_9ACTN|nr:helix-turn-helix transcriptional regulator [Streptomyces triticagri]RFU83030.1 XRE family transcriptional regulator [Streptomyces triticagri]